MRIMPCRNTLPLLLACLFVLPTSAVVASEAVDSRAAAASEDGLVSLLSAEFELQGGETASAAASYLKAAEGSDDSALAERAARVALAAGEPDIAQRALARWAELKPEAVERLPLEANLALNLGQRQVAVDSLRQLLKQDDGSQWQLALQAMAQTESRELSASVLGDLVDADALPAEPDAWYGFGSLARNLGDDALSDRMADIAMQRFPDRARVWLWQADRQRRAGDLSAARSAVDKALALEPEDTRLRMTAATELNTQGDPAAAAAILAKGPQNALIRTGRLAYLARAHDEAGLSALYEEIKAEIAEDPSRLDDPQRFLLGQLGELLKRPQEAMEWYEGVRDPARRGEAALRIAVQLEALDRLDDAEDRLREMQASEAEDGQAVRDSYLLQAELLRKHQRAQDAVDTYSRGLLIFEDDPQLLYARALTYESLDQVDKAEADLKRLVELDPEDANALNALGYTLADRTQRFEEALGYIRRALEIEPEAAAMVDSLGWVMYRMGNAKEALVQLRKAFELQPDPEVAAHLGEVLWQSGQREQARAIWQRGLELDPDNVVLKDTMQRLDA